jgi:hypothetical protein
MKGKKAFGLHTLKNFNPAKAARNKVKEKLRLLTFRLGN